MEPKGICRIGMQERLVFRERRAQHGLPVRSLGGTRQISPLAKLTKHSLKAV